MARSFNGSSDLIDLANEVNFDFERTQAFSVACWCYRTGTGGTLVGKQLSNGGGWLPFYQIASGGIQTYLVNTDPGNIIQVDTTTYVLPASTWAHLTFTYSGSSLASGVTIYANGISQALTTVTDTLSATMLNNVAVQLGANNGVNFWSGNLAGVGIWNVALSAANVATLATGESPVNVANASLIAALPLCGSSPEPDKKGTNNGTLTGTAVVGGPTQFVGCRWADVAWLTA